MAAEQVGDLITTLHERFGDELTSPQQKELMDQLSAHAHDINEKDTPDPTFVETLELILVETEEQHPHAAQVVRQILDVLKNIGV